MRKFKYINIIFSIKIKLLVIINYVYYYQLKLLIITNHENFKI